MFSTKLASRIAVLGGLGLLAASAAAACSASGTSSSHFNGNGGSGSGAGQPSGSTADSSGAGLGGGNVLAGTGGAGNSSGSGTTTCAAEPHVAMQLPLDMYIMQDQSGSMSQSVMGGGTKWQAVTGAIASFVQQPGLGGIGVGIQYFGLGAANCACASNSDCTMPGDFCFAGICFVCAASSGGDSCNASDYAKPEVEIAALPGVAGAIVTSLGKHMPATSTPTQPALQGAVDHAKAWATSHPGHVVIAVLSTDGIPTECSVQDQAGIAAIAAAALAGTPSIKTFAIGTFAPGDIPQGPNLLDAVAAAGGTGQAFNINTTQNVNQAFLDALNKIRGTALGCQYAIPMPMMGNADPSKVNVQYTPGGGGTPVIFPQVTDKAHCPASGDAWYYDNDAKPTLILLCDATCNKVGADGKGKIDILLGCKTKMQM